MNVCRTHHLPLKYYTQQKLFSQKKLPAPTAHTLVGKKAIKAHHALTRLAENKELFRELSTIHFLFFLKWAPVFPIEMNSTGHTAHAIIQSNPLEQKYYKKIDSLEIFETELKNSEEGVFSLSIPLIFYNDGIQYDGINLTIIKTNDNFIVIRSLDRYLKAEKTFYDHKSFTKEILNPLKDLVNHSGFWDFEECEAHYKLTGEPLVFQLVGASIPRTFGTTVRYGRTTDSIQEKEHFVRLGKVLDGTYQWPPKE